MSSDKNKEQLSDAGESTSKTESDNDLPKKTAFDWSLFDNRADVLKDLRQKQEFVDLMLTTDDGGEEVVHFAVVSALSKVLTQYINYEIKSSTDNEVVLQNGTTVKRVLVKNMNKSILKAVVDCSYSGSLQTNNVEVWPLIESAELYVMEDVLDSSLTYLTQQISIENCVKIFNSGLKFKHKLSNACYAFIRINFTEIVDNCIDFANLKINELTALIADDELNINTEKTVFKAIIRWINGDIISRKDRLFDLISMTRFGRIESSFMLTDMKNNQLISEDNRCLNLISKFLEDYKSLSRKKDGNGFYVAVNPISVRPRIPHEIILAFGGWQEGIPSTVMECYDIRTNLWFDTKLSNERPRAYHGIEVIDGMFYVIGGTNGTQILKSVESFNPITKKWYERSSMSENRCYVSTVSIDGIIYAMGGHNGRQRIKTCEKYDPIIDKWIPFEDMNMIRSDASATAHQNKIYIAGGLNDQMIENTIEVYDPLNKSWSFIQPMQTPRTSLGLVSFRKYLFAIGGNNGIDRLQSVERYDFRLKTWLPMANMLSKRSTFDTAIIENQLFVIGGYNGQTPICSVERYNINENVWTEVRNLKHDRSGLSVCVLKGLSNTIDYTFIGINSKKDKNKNKIIITERESRSEPIDYEIDID